METESFLSAGEPEEKVSTVELSADMDPMSSVVPGKLVHFAEVSVKALRAKVCIGGHFVDALVDTGASRSLISQALTARLNLIPRQIDCVFKEIGNKEVQTAGVVSVLLSIQGVQMNSADFVVFNSDFKQSLILGVDFLESNRLEISVRDRKLIKYFEDDSALEVYLDESGDSKVRVARNLVCYASQSVNIAPNSAATVLVYFSEGVSEGMLLYSDDL